MLPAFPQRLATFLFAAGMMLLWGCQVEAAQHAEVPTDTTRFGEPVALGRVAYDPIREASGIVASRTHRDVLWTHNDSGDEPRLYALTPRGEHLGVYTLAGATARDWEDIALGPGPDPGVDYLYVGDIGDNEARYDRKYVYRVPEPVVRAGQPPVDTTLTGVERITLQYPDGRADAETLLLDPLTKDLYIVTKRNTTVTVYRAAYPPSTTEAVVMEPAATLRLAPVPGLSSDGQGAVGGDVSPSGLEVLLKTYARVYYWQRASGAQPLFTPPPMTLPYIAEPQGEAIGWAADGSGYYTLSEERAGIPATVYFYPRLSGPGLD